MARGSVVSIHAVALEPVCQVITRSTVLTWVADTFINVSFTQSSRVSGDAVAFESIYEILASSTIATLYGSTLVNVCFALLSRVSRLALAGEHVHTRGRASCSVLAWVG